MKAENINIALPQSSKPPSPAQLIAKADQDADGKLSETEWQTITDKISLHHGVELDAAQLLTQYDEDGDGALGENDAKNALAGIGDELGLRPPPPPPPPSMDEIFAQADEDEDSLLSLNEWQTLIDKISQNQEITINAQEWLERFDEDGDAALNQDEAKNAMEALMAKFRPQSANETQDPTLSEQIKTYIENAKLGNE